MVTKSAKLSISTSSPKEEGVALPSLRVAAAGHRVLRTDAPTHRDSITILITAKDRHASKRIALRDDGSVGILAFNAGALFGYLTRDVTDIGTLSQLVQAIEELPNALVIRGSPRSGLEGDNSVRRKKTNFQTPTGGRQWVMLDFDKIPLPPGLLLAVDVGAVSEYLISLLPPEFHNVSYHWQLSSSAGFTDLSVVSMHLWFWLDRPVPDAGLKAWANDWNAKACRKIIDPALFNDVQPHYTAAPMFVGVTDPFPVRSGLTRKAVDAVSIRLPAPTAKAHASRKTAGFSMPSGGGFDAILSQIGDHDGGRGFHEPIIRAVASYVAASEGEKTDVEALYQTVQARVLAADRSKHDDGYVKGMACREHIIPAIETAIKKYGKTDNPRRKARQIDGIPPHFESKRTSVAAASAHLQHVINKLLG